MRFLAVLATSASLVCASAAARAQPDFDDESSYEERERYEERSPEDDAGERGDSDHDGHAGNLGLGFMGARFVPTATGGPTPTVVLTDDGDAIVTIEEDEVTVPIFGARYWINRRFGVDLGFGFNVAGGSVSRQIPNPDPALAHSVEFSTPSTTAIVGHLSLPVSVYSIGHLNVLLLPEMDIGYSTSTVENFELSTTGEWLDLRLGGFSFGAGARVGAEVSWGFIELPQVSLQVSWGVRIEHRRSTGKIGDAEMVIERTQFGTSWYDDPWALFAGNIGVYYYF